MCIVDFDFPRIGVGFPTEFSQFVCCRVLAKENFSSIIQLCSLPCRLAMTPSRCNLAASEQVNLGNASRGMHVYIGKQMALYTFYISLRVNAVLSVLGTDTVVKQVFSDLNKYICLNSVMSVYFLHVDVTNIA
jgi:hypothetical protein